MSGTFSGAATFFVSAEPWLGSPSSMLAKLNTFALVGIDAVPVEVEVDVSAGLPKTVLVSTV
jgi:hypothetical protein